ncbi:MAG: septal ring lytic transglycosylase RlpA family protein [Allosphingosinicella sp.]
MATAPTAILFGAAGVPAARAPIVASASAAVPQMPLVQIDRAAPAPARTPPPERPRGDTVEASYYGKGFAGRPTASGERFDPKLLTAAHRTLAFGTLVKVTDTVTGKSVVVRINDRGPFHGNRVLDLSEGAARQIGLAERGAGKVVMDVLRG